MGQATSQAALVKNARLGLIGHLRDDELEVTMIIYKCTVIIVDFLNRKRFNI